MSATLRPCSQALDPGVKRTEYRTTDIEYPRAYQVSKELRAGTDTGATADATVVCLQVCSELNTAVRADGASLAPRTLVGIVGSLRRAATQAPAGEFRSIATPLLRSTLEAAMHPEGMGRMQFCLHIVIVRPLPACYQRSSASCHTYACEHT